MGAWDQSVDVQRMGGRWRTDGRRMDMDMEDELMEDGQNIGRVENGLRMTCTSLHTTS